MGILSELEPKAVFKYFEEICDIPHGSADTKRISDYCVNFAKEHGLKYIKDESNNVMIFKNGTKGYENSKPVIIQGHLDMVCEKESGCDIDFTKEGLRLGICDGFIYAAGTTLGGDDGIAIAYALAILASHEIEHPPIEAVFTVDEEIGMLGAAVIDCSDLKADTMLNIDSEEEGYLLVSCAGGVTATCHLPIMYEKMDYDESQNANSDFDGSMVKILVSGLEGGHSGTEIDKGRANANQILGRILYGLKKYIHFNLIDIYGGLKDNAIPREANAEILLYSDNEHDVQQVRNKVNEIIDEYNKILKNEYRQTDSNINITIQDIERNCNVFSRESTDKVITALVNLPCGIYKMSSDIEGLVQTSLNLGILKIVNQEVIFSFSVRSSIKSEKDELVSRMECLMEALSGYVTKVGEYPAWEYKNDSRLRGIMVKVYEKQYGKKPVIQAIHAGVECGLFAGKIEGLDCVSFGPDILDIHTPKERLNIDSVERVWKYLIEVLKQLR